MNAPLGYAEDGDIVTLRMTRDDWELLLMVMGMGAGRLYAQSDPETFRRVIELANRLNAGNPNFRPYETGGKI